MQVVGLHHIQLAMPVGEEAAARKFYGGVLGFVEVEKPPALRERGGCWFEAGVVRVHLGVEADFRAAAKAHPCFLVASIQVWTAHFAKLDIRFDPDDAIPDVVRGYIWDPFGNRIEIMER